jgi:hypothetical protein
VQDLVVAQRLRNMLLEVFAAKLQNEDQAQNQLAREE